MKKINNAFNTLITLIILFVLNKPATISNYYYINTFCNYSAIILGIVFITLFINNFKKLKFSKIASVYFFILLASTVLNKGDINFYIKTYLTIFELVVFSELSIMKNKEKYFKRLKLFIFLMLSINLATILVLGTENIWGHRMSFLGYDNTCLPFIIMSAIIYITIDIYQYEKFNKKTFIFTLILFFNNILVESSNAKVSLILIIIYLILLKLNITKSKKYSKIFNYKIYLYFSVLFFLLIVIFRMQYLFEDIIVNQLHRNLTFTGRTNIWDKALIYINKRPLLGYGVEEFSVRAISKGIFHAHSTYLNILLEGGIVTLSAYFTLLFTVWNKIKKDINNKFVSILSWGALIYFIMTIIEFYKQSHMFFVLLLLLYNYKIFENETTK